MAEVNFCEECNNILYARSDKKNKKLIYVCRSCDYISNQQNENNNIVARINYNYNRKEDVYIHPETKNDPALGRVRDWICKQCGNTEAVFLQLPEKISYNPMALIYVCTNKNCQYWEKEIQHSNYDASNYNKKNGDLSNQFDEIDSKLYIKHENDQSMGDSNNKRWSARAGNKYPPIKSEVSDQNEEHEQVQLKQELFKIISSNQNAEEENAELGEASDSSVDEYF
ncbi:DNA-directed RNA polymerase II subunit RPB9, putative [Plasmodium chabaudi chabaudi]|uniref:DNA-directed RNA polymerase II subunit RPB9, putative n=2 Tax=Plasmodium chabaudi TaxID=5825 RepID=A0A077TID8_PLACU|nr:DNA-directed RNA polymerase II subunit RPB9, putative [Plasmodium chabaudi chabaudi]SCL99100.1 DNA-directed RNA polymerase II subunit RPB9, putative [Plasmodium chabaudi adami]SCL96099.1 DNA-directed RNA polymerase II subunit RPB9, putative [Plasmodium chabaudi chabaudi]SCL96380.1 DNA-directed RNA polymerase II subunit RPB9, putative [Plasmodium chabaudi chabaudi]SCM03517.1 DNA-directed RNA polymerase II subunit RPB9, putative [Plasmodium chabaudi adami]VTZ66794.1 DNA-directed RNA polymeras|eukprot:XP_738740.2 DNA-directed RNA polymerase 2 subunit, putative [Plasmodium chabaudi chabaudi]